MIDFFVVEIKQTLIFKNFDLSRQNSIKYDKKNSVSQRKEFYFGGKYLVQDINSSLFFENFSGSK